MLPEAEKPGTLVNPPRKERIVELDVLRSLAFMAVVLQHTLGVYIRKPDIGMADSTMVGMLFNFSKFAVPAFVFVTGVVLFYNYYDSINYPEFIIRRLLEVFVPYILWTGIYEIYYHGMPAPDIHWLAGLIKKLLLGAGSYHLWFVVMIFQFYVLYPLLLGLFKRFRKFTVDRTRFIVAAVASALLYTLLMWFSASYIAGGNLHVKNVFLQLLVKYRDRNSLFFVFYFFWGGAAGIALAKWREFVIRSVNWNVFAFLALFLLVGYELMINASGGRVNLNYSTSLKPSMFFYTVSELLLVYGMALAVARNGAGTFKLLNFIGKYSYGAYLAHALVLTYAVKAVTRFWPYQQHYLWSSILSFTLCSLGSVAVTFFISRLPLGRLLTGVIKK